MSEIEVKEVNLKDAIKFKQEKVVILKRKTIIVEEAEYHYQMVKDVPVENGNGHPPFGKQVLSKIEHTDYEKLPNLSIDDLQERKELARIVGLETLPVKTPDAFAKIIGIFDSIVVDSAEIDTTKMVKALRRRCK
jgi:hypothetical protein